MTRMSVSARDRFARFFAISAAMALSFAACATAPKPTALAAYEDLQRDPNLEETRKHFPELVASAEQYGQKADKDWQSNNIEDSTKEASMAEIKLKTALSRYEQDRAKARLQSVVTDQSRADETLADIDKELSGLNEQIKFMQKSAAAEADKKRLSEQIATEHQRAEDERQKMSQQLQTEQKRSDVQMALRTAETVEAPKYAAAEYGAATAMLAKADAEIKQASWGAALASLEVARAQAEKATAAAKPSYEQAAELTNSRARAESLARDAAALPGLSVRPDPRGELQRLVITVPDLFTKSQTTLAAGKEAVLEPVARLISKYPNYPIQVAGHTDSRGKPSELIALSQARAQSVFLFLVSRGIEARRLMVDPQGPNEPISDNKTPSGRAKNNRIEIIFLYH